MSEDETDFSRTYLITPEKSAKKPQYVAALGASLCAFSLGCCIGYSSPAGVDLSSNSTDGDKVHFTNDQETSWFSSIITIGCFFGCPIGGVLIKKFGRIKTMLMLPIPFTIGWILIGFGVNFIMLVVGRLVTGLTGGIASIAAPTYISEIASAECRGTLGSSFQLMITIGILYTYLFGTFLTWRWLVLASAVSPFVMAAILFFQPESPSYHLINGRYEEARKSLQHFRGPNWNIEEELDELTRGVEEAEKNKASLKTLWIPYIRKPLMVSMTLFVFQQFSGLTAVVFNLELIFSVAGAANLASWSGVIVGAVQVIGTIGGTVLMDRAGRKILLAISSGIMSVSIGVMGVYFYYFENDITVADKMNWLPLAALVTFIGASAIGIGPVPWVLMGEIFQPNVREIAGSIAVQTNWGMAFITSYSFLPLQSLIDAYGVYWLFSACCMMCLGFTIVVLKETKGKSLQEICESYGAPKIESETFDEPDRSNTRSKYQSI